MSCNINNEEEKSQGIIYREIPKKYLCAFL